jgi:hypothetical protein
MLYKPDWEEVRQRLLAWWQGELTDRVVLQVTAPRAGAANGNQWNAFYLAQHLDDPERVLEEWEKYCRATFFGGEFVPALWTNLGPGVPAAYLGCKLRVTEDTIWFEPPGDVSLEEIIGKRLDPAEPLWAQTRRLTELSAERGRGKYLAGLTDLNSVFDIICHLRGTQRVLYDLMDRPETVKAACDHVNRIWIECYDTLSAILGRHMQGTANWMYLWFPGRGSDVQCDFSAMLSPAMFEEFVLPHLAGECRSLDQSIYHLDGPNQIPHLDLLLDLPELSGIQWVPGAGNPGTGSPRWFAMYRRILERGKRLLLQGMDPADVEGVLAALPARGLLIETKMDTEDQAQDLLKKAARWTHD